MTSHGKAREIGDAGSATETNSDLIEHSKTTRAKDALNALRSGEPPLGSLTSEEQSWLAAAFAHLNRIYEKREAGRPGNNAVCVFDVGNVYVQFLAPWDAELLVCEAVSAKFVPEIAAVLTAGCGGVNRTARRRLRVVSAAAGCRNCRAKGFMMPRPCQRVRLESGLKLDLNRLAQQGFIRRGAYSTSGISWCRDGEEIALGIITADMSGPEGPHGWFRIQIGSLDQRIPWRK
jgi:hypothetical protein